MWIAERQRAVGVALDLEALFVHRAVVATTENREIRQRRWPALRPVADVMTLPDPHPATGEATAAVPMLERAPQRRRNGPGPRPDLDESALGIVTHHDARRVAGEALGRFRGNAYAVFEDRLARLIGIRDDIGIDMDHHLVAPAGGAGIDPVMQRGFGE